MIKTLLSRAARTVSSLPRVPGAVSFAVRVEARILRREARSKPGDFWPAVVLQAAAGGFFWMGLWFSLHTVRGFLGGGDPGLALAVASLFLATYAFLWFCVALGGGSEIVPISRLEKLSELRWTPGQAYAAGLLMAACQPLALFMSLVFLTTGFMLFPPAGAGSALFSCLATGMTALGMVACIQGARCAIELASWKGALRTLARVLAGGLLMALTVLLAWPHIDGEWTSRIPLPGSWIDMAPTSQLARAYHLAGEGRLADLPWPLALLGAFAGSRLPLRLAPDAPAGLPRGRGPPGPRGYGRPDDGSRRMARAGAAAPLSEPRGSRGDVRAPLEADLDTGGVGGDAGLCTGHHLLPSRSLRRQTGQSPYSWQMHGLAFVFLAVFQAGQATNLFSREAEPPAITCSFPSTSGRSWPARTSPLRSSSTR